MPFVWAGAGLAAVAAAIAIMFKGGMVEKRKRPALGGAGGSADGSGLPGESGDQEDPFKRYPGAAGEGPRPTQASTEQLDSGVEWGSPTGEAAVSYSSPGDSSDGNTGPTGEPAQLETGPAWAYSTAQAAPARFAGGGGYQAPAPVVQQAISQEIASGSFGSSSVYVPYTGSVSAPSSSTGRRGMIAI